MKILMLAWRDMKHPKKGGAEVVSDIYLKGLSKKHNVTLLSSKFKGCKEKEKYNGYNIVRIGNVVTVHLLGLLYAKLKKYDIVIEQINTIPFLTPLIIPKSKRLLFIHQLARNVLYYEMFFPIALVANIAEWLYLKLYKNVKSITVSNSTKSDLQKYALCKEVYVIENQIDFKPALKISKKEKIFVYCGRLKKSKRVHYSIIALSKIKDAKLYIIGQGDKYYVSYLKKLVKRRGLDKRVIFAGFLSKKKRNELMAKALAILVTSVREGWGLIVTEANANGTLAITYDVPGLRDANKTGFITSKNNPDQLALHMNKVMNDRKLMELKSKDSLVFAKEHNNWNNNIKKFEKVILSDYTSG